MYMHTYNKFSFKAEIVNIFWQILKKYVRLYPLLGPIKIIVTNYERLTIKNKHYKLNLSTWPIRISNTNSCSSDCMNQSIWILSVTNPQVWFAARPWTRWSVELDRLWVDIQTAVFYHCLLVLWRVSV